MQPNDSPLSTFEPPHAAVESSGHPLPIVFTGSGSEYFRIWIVNLLLTLVTLGLYFPWAKVRRLRYFHGNTLVGDHALDFHGNPRRMLRGYLLVAALVGLYSVAGQVSPAAGLVALLIVAGLWPALFRASMQFRLANTSWRGLRFHFTGSLGGAYRAMLPIFVPSVLLVGAGLFLNAAGADESPGDVVAIKVALQMAAGVLVLLFMLIAPLLWWMLKKYQHDNYALGSTQTELRTGPGAFYAVLAKTFGVMVLAAFAGGALAALLGGGGALLLGGFDAIPSDGSGKFFVMLMVVLVAGYGSVILVVRPYVVSRLQNLVWTRTKSSDLRFVSTLRFWPLLGLTVKNWLLVVITLGLYWPFAVVAMARLRLQAITAFTKRPADEFAARTQARRDDAAGEAAGDLFGIDIGL